MKRIDFEICVLLPLDTTELYIWTSFVFSMWIPSVFGLVEGDLMKRESMLTSRHPSKRKWNCGLLAILSPCIVRLELMKNLMA